MIFATATRESTLPYEPWRLAGTEARRRAAGDRVEAIQLLRAGSLLLVFFFHFAGVLSVTTGPAASTATQWALSWGSLGTNSFLVVSGALGWISCQRAAEPWTQFARRRIYRLYPSYLAVVSLYLVLSVLFPSQSKFPASWLESGWYLLRNLILVPGVFPERPLITVTWALALILTFHLLTPGLRKAVAWIAGNGRRETHVLGLMGLAWVVSCTAWPMLPVRLVFLLAGCLVASSLTEPGRWWGDRRDCFLAGGASLVIYACLLNWAPGGVAGLLVSLLGLMALTRASLMSGTTWRMAGPFVALGNMSYSFYLVHGLSIKFLLVVVLPLVGREWAGWGLAPPALTGAVVSSIALFRFVEQPGRWPWQTTRPTRTREARVAGSVLHAMAARA